MTRRRRRLALAAVALATAAGLAAVVVVHVTRAPRPPRSTERHSTTTLVVRITDRRSQIAGGGDPDGSAGGAGGRAPRGIDRDAPVAARMLLIDAHGAALHMGNLDLYGRRQGAAACALAPGVVGSWDGLILGHGTAEVPVGVDRCVPSPAIPYGRYKVVAWRGIEYERFEGEVDLSEGLGRVELAIALDRAWTPLGVLAADLHVHARASSDSRLPNPQRVIAQAAAGIQVVGLSDHNVNGDLDAESSSTSEFTRSTSSAVRRTVAGRPAPRSRTPARSSCSTSRTPCQAIRWCSSTTRGSA